MYNILNNEYEAKRNVHALTYKLFSKYKAIFPLYSIQMRKTTQ